MTKNKHFIVTGQYLPQKPCKHCGEPFYPPQNNYLYCSERCRQLGPKIRQCVLCTKVFEAPDNRYRRHQNICCVACTGDLAHQCTGDEGYLTIAPGTSLEKFLPQPPRTYDKLGRPIRFNCICTKCHISFQSWTKDDPFCQTDRQKTRQKALRDSSLSTYTKRCLECGEEITTTKTNQVFHIPSCYTGKRLPKRNCSQCMRTFFPLKEAQTQCENPCGNISINKDFPNEVYEQAARATTSTRGLPPEAILTPLMHKEGDHPYDFAPSPAEPTAFLRGRIRRDEGKLQKAMEENAPPEKIKELRDNLAAMRRMLRSHGEED